MKSYQVVGAFLLLLAFGVLLKIETDPSKFSAIQSTIINVNHRDLFRFICHTDTVEMWFQWISHFRSADMKPMGIGKLYQAVYKIPLLGDYVILLRTTDYKPDFRMVLEGGSVLNPRIEINSFPVSNRRTRVIFKLTFQKHSLIFQYTLGSLLHSLAQQHMKKSLTFLSKL